MSVLESMPSWVVVVISAVACGTLAVGFRLIMVRSLGEDRSSAAAVAGPLMPALGAVFALLAATTLGAEAAQFRAAGDDVSAESAAASRLAWASTSPGLDSTAIQRALVTYLASTRAHEWEGGQSDGDPRTMRHLDELERTVRAEAAGTTVPSAQAGELLTSLDSLTSLRRQRLAHATSHLPDLYLLVVLMSGLALVANSAALAVTHRPRVALLTAGLVCVVALAMALLVAISAPFEGGFIVDGHPIDAVRADLSTGAFQP